MSLNPLKRKTIDEYDDSKLDLDNVVDLSRQSEILMDNPFKAPEYLKKISRKYVVKIKGSMADFDAGQAEAVWAPNPNASDIFRCNTRYNSDPDAERLADPHGDIKNNFLLIGARLEKVDNGFPVDLKLDIHGIKGNYYTGVGQQYAYHVSRNEKNDNMDKVIARTNPYLWSEYLRTYRGMLGENIREEIVDLKKDNLAIVPVDHPIVAMINSDEENNQFHLGEANKFSEQFFQVDKDLAEQCMATLQKDLVDNLPLVNMSQFNARIERPDGYAWTSNDGLENVDAENLDRIMNAQRQFSAVVELTFAYA